MFCIDSGTQRLAAVVANYIVLCFGYTVQALRVMVDGAGLDGNVILSDPILERD